MTFIDKEGSVSREKYFIRLLYLVEQSVTESQIIKEKTKELVNKLLPENVLITESYSTKKEIGELENKKGTQGFYSLMNENLVKISNNIYETNLLIERILSEFPDNQ